MSEGLNESGVGAVELWCKYLEFKILEVYRLRACMHALLKKCSLNVPTSCILIHESRVNFWRTLVESLNSL